MSGPDPAGRLDEYVRRLFAAEDPVLRELRGAMADRDLPEIYISPDLGRLLQLLLTMVGARRVLEVGTLGGYSAIWMARALPPEGRLVTLELDPDRAEVAREFARRAGLEDVIDVRVGDARDRLAELVEQGGEPFDAAFIDADKEGYVEYLERSIELVRPGGLILADNAFRDGRILDDAPDDATRGVLDYNRSIASDPRLVSTVIPIRDGLAVSVLRRSTATG